MKINSISHTMHKQSMEFIAKNLIILHHYKLTSGESVPLGTHQVMCLGLPSSAPFGCFRGLGDFTHQIKCHVLPGEADGKHGSSLAGTDSDLLSSSCRVPASTHRGVSSQHPSLPLQQLQLISPRGELAHTSRDTLSLSHSLTQRLAPQVKILNQCSALYNTQGHGRRMSVRICSLLSKAIHSFPASSATVHLTALQASS